jgi:transposase
MDISSASIHVEAVDDLPIVLSCLEQLGLPTLLSQVIGTHGTTRRYKALENGLAIVMWLLFVLSQADHRKYTVAAWVAQHQQTLQAAFCHPIMPEELSDDRLSTLLTRLACRETQEALDEALAARTVHVYCLDAIKLLAVHLDATTTYGFHALIPDGLLQLGRGKDGPPDAPTVKLMAATMGAGHYLTGLVAPGSAADDPLYRPVLTQAGQILKPLATPLLFVGDAKFAALESRALCQAQGHTYVLPLDAAILTYRGVPAGIERFFHLLKGRSLGLHPLFVHTDMQIRGLLYLLTLAARILTYLEGVVRKTLRISRTGLTHLILNNLHKAVEKPTIRQLLEAVCRSSIALVTLHETTGTVSRHLTPIPEVVEKIVWAMRLPDDTYLRLIRDQ